MTSWNLAGTDDAGAETATARRLSHIPVQRGQSNAHSQDMQQKLGMNWGKTNHININCFEKFQKWILFGAIFAFFWASPGPGLAGNGFSSKNDSQFKGRHSNPCPGDPFRGPFRF